MSRTLRVGEMHSPAIGRSAMRSAARESFAVLVLGVALAVAACGVLPSPSPRPTMSISNGTALAVTVFVNGREVGVVPPYAPISTIDVGTLGPLPWSVEARSPSGRVLLAMPIDSETAMYTTDPDGRVVTRGATGLVELICGSLKIWYGFDLTSEPLPEPSGAPPGSCDP